MPITQLLIFAKYPTPGSVMTRLCPPLTADEAAGVQRACIRLLCERALRSWPVRPTLVASPDESEAPFREFLGPYMPIMPQGAGDLGARLTRAAKAALQEDAETVIIIGSDSPSMPRQLLIEAVHALETSDAVLGPCEDGGFYLVGLGRTHDDMFSRIDWSGDQAASQTRERLGASGLSVAEIDPWYDIDRFEDLGRVLSDIKAGGNSDDYELRRVLETILESANESIPGAEV